MSKTNGPLAYVAKVVMQALQLFGVQPVPIKLHLLTQATEVSHQPMAVQRAMAPSRLMKIRNTTSWNIFFIFNNNVKI